MDEIKNIIMNTPLISDQRIEFYSQVMQYRKELILDKAYEQLLDYDLQNAKARRMGDLSIIECSNMIPEKFIDEVNRGDQTLITSETGEAYFIGENEIGQRLFGEYGGDCENMGGSWIWHGECADHEELETFVSYMVRSLDLER